MQDHLANPLIGRRGAFKFCASENLNAIWRRGSTRIGSLAEFRALESKALRDEDEGQVRQVADDPEPISYEEFHPDSVARNCLRQESGGRISARNVIFQTPYDFATYCFSYQFTREVFQSLSDEGNQYDSCVEIIDLRRFAETLSDFLAKSSNTPILRYLSLPVQYGDISNSVRDRPYSAVRRAFIKPLVFSANTEGRIVLFEPGKEQSGYTRVTFSAGNIFLIPNVTNLVRPIEIPAAWRR
jgi:hypothetical protein